MQHGPVPLPAVAEPGPNPREELVEREGLCEIVLGPQLETHHLGGWIPQGGEHDHTLTRIVRQDALQYITPVEAGHEEIEDDQVVGLGGGHGKPGSRVGGGPDLVALRPELPGHEVQDPGFIIDDQDSGGHRRQRC